MRASLRAVIFLTLLATTSPDRARAHENVPGCGGALGAPGPDLGWLDELSDRLDESVTEPGAPSRRTEPREAPSPEPSVAERKPSPRRTPEASPVPVVARPSSAYDVTDDPPAKLLSKLRKAAYAAADKRRKGIQGRKKSKYLCYQAVKEMLDATGLVDRKWSEEAAVNAHRHGSLAKRGFRNVMTEGYDSKNAPLGAILVYSGGRYRCADDRGRARKLQCGHIEVRTRENEYCSDYCKNKPVDAYITRTLVGVYVKE